MNATKGKDCNECNSNHILPFYQDLSWWWETVLQSLKRRNQTFNYYFNPQEWLMSWVKAMMITPSLSLHISRLMLLHQEREEVPKQKKNLSKHEVCSVWCTHWPLKTRMTNICNHFSCTVSSGNAFQENIFMETWCVFFSIILYFCALWCLI